MILLAQPNTPQFLLLLDIKCSEVIVKDIWRPPRKSELAPKLLRQESYAMQSFNHINGFRS